MSIKKLSNMKNYLLLAALFVASILTNNIQAQVNDPLNHGVWSNESEEVISKKKKTNNNATTQTKEIQSTEQGIDIQNSCPEKISVELISLAGNRASQTVDITIKYTNHDVNATMRIRDFLAYNEEGNEFSVYNAGSNESFTDVPIKASWRVGQMLPSKNNKLPVISFRINDCTIEMRNIPIEWR